MIVTAAPGLKVPKEGKPREYIDDQTPVDVPATAYYQRLLADGSLAPARVAEAKKGAK